MSIFAASADDRLHAREVAESLGYPIAHGVRRDQGDAIGAWWAESRNHIQPSEFVLTRDGRVMASTYSNSPIGRMDPEETLSLLEFMLSR